MSLAFFFYSFRGSVPLGWGLLYGNGMQVPLFGNSSYHGLFCDLGESFQGQIITPHPTPSNLSTSVGLPSLSGMIDLYLIKEIGGRMGEDCPDFLKDKNGLLFSCERMCFTGCD